MSSVYDLTGKRFGKLTVIEKSETRDSRNSVLWECKCDCGKSCAVITNSLTSGNKKSCGCLSGSRFDLTEKRFGKLTVIKKSDAKDARGAILWECKCECGNICKVNTHNLNSGGVKSCGCLKNEPRPVHDLMGKRFGKLTVIEISSEKGSRGAILWLCKCDCGKIFNVLTASLTHGGTKSCGCLRIPIKAGQRFGRLTAIKLTEEKDKRGAKKWECKCDCGNSCNVITNKLTTGRVKSCGCLEAETQKNVDYKKAQEGLVRSKETNYSNLLSPKPSSRNKLGVKGVSFDPNRKSTQKYHAYIKRKSLGYFETLEEAKQARKEAEYEYLCELEPHLQEKIMRDTKRPAE
jgi:hypothetical protein